MSTRPGDGFSRFVAISVAAHVGIVVSLLALVFLARPKEQPVASFELVGTPGLPEGSTGAPEGGSASAAKDGGAVAPPSEPQAPEDSTEPSVLPSEKAAPSDGKSRQTAKPPARSEVNAGTSKTPGKTAANAGRGNGEGKGFLNGKGGTGTDTIELGNGGGGGGAPSYMSSWLSRVRTLVERQWRNVPAGWGTPKGAPVVVFAIARDGQRSGRPELVHASGNSLVDHMALRAIQAVDAFPPPPQAWPKEEVKLRYVLEVHSP
jgi:outer membrane biosynthesis protein TonB